MNRNESTSSENTMESSSNRVMKKTFNQPFLLINFKLLVASSRIKPPSGFPK